MGGVTCHVPRVTRSRATCCRGQQQANCWSSFSWSSLYDRGTDSSLSWADDVGHAGHDHEVTCHVSRAGVRAGDHGDGAAAAGRGGGAVLRPARGAEAEEGVPGVGAGARVPAVAGPVPQPQVTPGQGRREDGVTGTCAGWLGKVSK